MGMSHKQTKILIFALQLDLAKIQWQHTFPRLDKNSYK